MDGAVGRFDGNRAAGNLNIGFALDAVVFRIDGNHAPAYVHIAFCGLVVLGGLHAITAGGDGKHASADLHGILSVQAVFNGVHGYASAIHHQAVFREYAVTVVAAHGKRSFAVHG